MNGNGENGLNGSSSTSTNAAGLPKIREILRRQKPDSEDEESPDIDFVYADSDEFAAEMAEFYSYTENPEMSTWEKAFEQAVGQFRGPDTPTTWRDLSEADQVQLVQSILAQTELADPRERLEAMRAILYIAQGCWMECQSDSECLDAIRTNVVLLYRHGAWTTFIELLNLEIENTQAALNASRKLAVSLADSTELRIILGVLYVMTEVLRDHPDQRLKDNFKAELNVPLDDDLFAIRLLTMVTRFCSGTAPHFPMKKVLLLLWKVLLTSLGGMDVLREMKDTYRKNAGLNPITEDTLTVSRLMRAASPPANAAELVESTNNRRSNRPGIKRSMMTKQSSLDDMGLEIVQELEDDFEDAAESSTIESGFGRDSPRPGVPMMELEELPRSLPWTPKVRQKDVDQFFDYTRMKFVGFTLDDDHTTLAGLPHSIQEGVYTLKKHMYKSLSEIQIEREDDIAQHPISRPEAPVAQTPTETLYQAMLPSLPQYVIALLKILLASAPTSKSKTDSINIMTDVLPEDMPMTVMQSMKLGIDVNRHKEIIVKAVSGVLLLLLKHFKVNHIYQFEFMSQHLVFANCIPLVLKFFNQNIMAYIGSKNNIALLDFPSCVIGEQPELTAQTLEIGDTSVYCWRNMFSCINLLRVLNKLTKWKHSRIMMLVVFKSAPILKRTLKVKHAMMQLYVLKLLKMQTKYLGRQWRKSNMKTMSAIYTKVRHRLNDDWAFGNDVDSRPWDFQAEECALRAAVDRFNQRRYDKGNFSDSENDNMDFDYEPVDNCLSSVLGQDVELTDEFKQNYEKWLEREVLNMEIQWEMLLDKNQPTFTT
ncbi:striatin-interacting protein 1-like [Tigriopus californicus]|uniref:striatin-interacting protein 1-like n=1 Tax=Tigriopus californicus TaxID=6832 RepID=UPI0027DA0B61|nr:striatin-interacting protein 1-like [Tigriopus californicus]|eukprot:TCALIF_11932-PA protein Name:"Similar to STRIP1 Striatin-interacting protein 1 (Homo sapiens)" AED:0.13 eAED:0.13 QI:151/1/1/1/0.92/1/14/105/820